MKKTVYLKSIEFLLAPCRLFCWMGTFRKVSLLVESDVSNINPVHLTKDDYLYILVT